MGGSTGWNGYLYANGNPANLTDPSGACIGPLTFLLPACIAAVVGVGYGAFTGARRWDIAHDCQCGDPYSLKTDRTHYILESMFKGGAAGAVGAVVLTLAPWAALPTAVVGVGLSGIQAASHWNPSNPYEQFERDEGILGTILGSIALPFAARHTSDALLNSQLSKLAATDPLFHSDVIYPQIQRGFLGRISEDTLAFLGFYPQADNYIETIRAYRFSDRKDTSSLLPRVYKNPIMRPLVALGMKFRWFRSLRAELHSDGITFASPYVSLGTDLQAMLSTRDEWLQSIMTGIPNLAQRAPDIGIFNIPVNRITYPRFTVGVRESEIMFRGNDLLKFLIEWNENPYGKTNPK